MRIKGEEEVGGEILVPMFEEEHRVHPVIDFNKTFYYGAWLDAQDLKTKKKRKNIFWIWSNNDLKRMENFEGIQFDRAEPPYSRLFEGVPKGLLQGVVSAVSGVSAVRKRPIKEVVLYDVSEYILYYKNSINFQISTTAHTALSAQTTLNILEAEFRKYIDLDASEDYFLLSLWTIGTYLHPLFVAYPYIFINGVKGCGKTKLLHLCKLISFHGLHAGSISSSVLFRIIDMYRPSIFIDEAEALANPKNAGELNSLLLNGYKKGTYALRSAQVADRVDFKVQDFELFCPKMLANIRGIDHVLESRCIPLVMRRTLKDVGNIEIEDTNEKWRYLRIMLYLFSANHWREVHANYISLDNTVGITNRDWELWKPLLAIAKTIGDTVFEELVEYAKVKTKERITEAAVEQFELILLEVLCKMVRDDGWFAVSEIVADLKDLYDEEQKWINSRTVGRMLGRLKFKNKRRVSQGTQYYLTIQDVRDMAERMGVKVPGEVGLEQYQENEEKADGRL